MIITMPYFRLFLAGFFLAACIPSFSQVVQPHRFEKETKYHDADFEVISLEKEGMALVREKNKFKSGKQTWEITLLDTVLHERETRDIEIDSKGELTGYEYAPGFLHLLFTLKDTKGRMSLLSIDLKSENSKLYEIEPELNFSISHFCKAGESFVLGGYVNLEPAVILFVPTTNNIKIVPGFFVKNTELVDVRANQNQTFNTLMIDRSDRAAQNIIFRTFDSSGKQLFDNIVAIDEDITLLNGITSTLKRDDLMIAGLFAKRNSKQPIGFYTIPVNPFGKQKISRAYFGQLTHYLDYLKPKKAAKIKSRTLEARENGKLPDFTSHVYPHKIIENDKGFLLLAESYNASSSNSYNQYSNVTPYYYSSPYYGGRPTNNPYNTPDRNPPQEIITEVSRIESVVIAFDASGEVLWDHSVKLDDIERPLLVQTADFSLREDSLHFLYKKESTLKIKNIEFGTDQLAETDAKIKPLAPTDEIRSEKPEFGEVRSWFGNSFYVWGYQSVRSKAGDYKTRDVFYINKLVVQ
jgi:hypothetical protein